jgi:serine/threonine-protein kinase
VITAAPSDGSIIAKRYELQALIGEGGMARVWRATDLTLARAVAVKFLFLREDRDRRTMIDRFLREARIAAAVRHANVVDLLDFGTTEDGRPFMVMELLEGESLEARLQREPTLTLKELVGVMAAVLDGLAAVHRAGIVHRDLKPGNIFLLDLDGEVRPKLLDFGVSRETDPSSGRRSALTTSDGYLVGTPEYMSPEQARGLKDVDWRTDLYSMGVVLYEALTGRLPFVCDAVGDLIIEIVAGSAPEVADLRPEVGRGLSEVVARAMRTKREDRFQTAREMRDALLAAAEESLGYGVRESLPMAVPVRRTSVSGPRPVRSSKPSGDGPSTLDALLPWGPSAVPAGLPSGDATPTSSAPKRAHSVETELPPTAPSARPRWMWAAIATLPIAGLATWLALRDVGQESAEATPTMAAQGVDAREAIVAEPPPAPPPEPPRAVAEAATPPAPVAPAVVRVTLEGLPSGARVRVDDAWVEPQGGVLELPRDGASRRLVVVASGREWRTTHRADADGTYPVRLRRASSGRGGEPASGDVFRELDY